VVNCKDFEGAFPELMRVITLTDKNRIDSLLLLINKLESSTINYSPGIRLKMILFSSKKTDTLSMGNFNIVMNGKHMKQSEELKDFLEKLKSEI
jgi:hypothetical protein